jgi:hypothetical protein
LFDAHQRFLEQHDDGREDMRARKRSAPEISADPLADRRQRAGKLSHLAVLRFLARIGPSRVVAVLLPPACIAPRRLDMAVRARADPHVFPRRRDNQRPNSEKSTGIANGASLRIAVSERLPPSDSRDAGLSVHDIVETGGSRSGLVTGDV